ncbi:PIN domain-containing protein [Desulfofundulus luciae]|uniref:PIN domain-containing protein n=1 Tax=Desulfofundulus luciae TaxID=74702 RepID=UPI0027D886E7|nr:PIN domain-containing protein [Desulfofundulus luciae]
MLAVGKRCPGFTRHGRKNIDFVDAYLAALAKQHEESVCSFDSDFEKLNVNLVKPPGYPQEK